MVPPLNPSVVRHIDFANSKTMRAGLASLGGENLAKKRARMAREQAARIAAHNRRPAPGTLAEPVKRADVPVTFKSGPRKPRRVERAATTTAPTPEPVSVAQCLASDVPADAKKKAAELKQAGALTSEWAEIGAGFYVRKQGASVRYGKAK